MPSEGVSFKRIDLLTNRGLQVYTLHFVRKVYFQRLPK